MSYANIALTDSRDGVAVLRLARAAQKNALSVAMRDELEDALARLAADDSVRAVVLAGAPGIFCAGFDLKEGAATGGKSFFHRFAEFFTACYRFPKPVIAAVDGPALAGGFDLVLMADFIVASERAIFGHPEIDFAPVAVSPLSRFVAPSRLRELCLLGERIDAVTAKSYGVVHAIVTTERLEAAAAALAGKLAAKPPQAVRATKQALNAALGVLVEADLAALAGSGISSDSTYRDYVAAKLTKP